MIRRSLLLAMLLLAVTPVAARAWQTTLRAEWPGVVAALVPDSEGGVWALVKKGRSLTATHVLNEGNIRAHRARYSRSARLAASPDGVTWIVDGVHRRLTRLNRYGVASTTHVPGRGSALIPSVTATYDADLHGIPWFPLRERGHWSLATISGGTTVKIRLALPRYAAASTGPSQIAADASDVWVIFGRALARVSIKTHQAIWHRLPHGATGKAIALNDGNAWIIGSNGRVIVQPADGPPRTLAHRVPKANRYSVASALDRLWLITPSGELDTFSSDGAASHRFTGADHVAVDAYGRPWLGGADGVRMIARSPRCSVPALLGMESASALRALADGGCGYRRARLPAMGTGPERVVWASAESAGQPPGSVVSVETSAAEGPCSFSGRWWQTVNGNDAVAGFATGLDDQELWACVKATGRRLRIAGESNDDDHGCDYCNSIGASLSGLALNGHWLAYTRVVGDRYSSDTTVKVLNVDAPTEIRTAEAPSSDGLRAYALNPHGELAFVAGFTSSVQVLRADGTHHAVGTVRGTVTNLAIDDTTVTWNDADGAHSAPIHSSP